MIQGLKAHLVELELRLQTQSTRGNASVLAELLSDEFREFGASGRVWHKGEIIAALLEETPGLITSNDFEGIQLSAEVALLTYTAMTADRRTLRSSVWRLEQGQWRLLFHQGTVIPD